MINENTDSTGVKVPKGQINYNTVAGSAGIASFLGLNARNILNGIGNGCDEGHGHGRHGHNYDPCYVTQNEMAYAQELDKANDRIARLESEKYTDNHILEAYRETVSQFKAADEKIAGVVKDTTSAFIETGKSVAVLQTQVECLKAQIENMKDNFNQKLDYEIAAAKKEAECCCKELRGAIELESERRKCGDENLYCYVNGTFVPGKLVMPKSSVCPEPMDRYNNWTAPAANQNNG